MMNAYIELKNKHQKEFNKLPLVYAFGQKQFEAGMHKLGLDPSEIDKVGSIFGVGDFCLKADIPHIMSVLRRQKKELRDAILMDSTGDGFAYDMFSSELANHEYSFTNEPTDALAACGITAAELNNDKRLMHAFLKAEKEQR